MQGASLARQRRTRTGALACACCWRDACAAFPAFAAKAGPGRAGGQAAGRAYFRETRTHAPGLPHYGVNAIACRRRWLPGFGRGKAWLRWNGLQVHCFDRRNMA